jgi:RNA polymerase-binding transcription factor DksA
MPAHRHLLFHSPFTIPQQLRWRRCLERMRAVLTDDFDRLSSQAFVAEKPGSGDPSTVEQPQEIVFAALDAARERLILINNALAKLDGAGDVPYGICEQTFEPIEVERLDLMPWTPLSALGADMTEKQPVEA